MLEQSLELLELLKTKRKEYDSLNDKIRAVQGSDFPTELRFIDDDVEKAIVDILNETFYSMVVVEDLAGYYLYEVSDSFPDGKIIIDGTEYVIRNIDDVKNLVVSVAMDKAGATNCS